MTAAVEEKTLRDWQRRESEALEARIADVQAMDVFEVKTDRGSVHYSFQLEALLMLG